MTTTIDTREIAEMSAYELATIAECYAPNSLDSAGAKFLTNLRDATIESIEGALCDGEEPAAVVESAAAFELTDGAPDVYTHQRWLEFVDLGAWEEEIEISTDGAEMTALAGAALTQIAERLVRALVDIVQDKYVALENEDEQ